MRRPRGAGAAAAATAASTAPEAPELRLAAYVALGELGVPGVVAEIAAAIRREDDPRVLGAASNALVAAAPAPALLAGLAPRVGQLLAAPEPRLREAGAELAGLLGGAVPPAALAPLAADPAPAVRGAAAWALGRLADPASEAALLAAFRDDDPAVHERAAAGLLRLGTPAALAQAIAYVAGDGDPTARGALAAAITIPRAHAAELGKAVDAALGKVGADDPAFEPLVRMKLEVAAAAPAPGSAPAAPDIDAELAAAFPSFSMLTKLAGFDGLVRSLRTAESLFQSTRGAEDADLSPPITLWMKVLENYVHAWLGPRLAGLQREPAALFEYVDRALGSGWPGYQRWLEPRWRDPVEVGGARRAAAARHPQRRARAAGAPAQATRRGAVGHRVVAPARAVRGRSPERLPQLAQARDQEQRPHDRARAPAPRARRRAQPRHAPRERRRDHAGRVPAQLLRPRLKI